MIALVLLLAARPDNPTASDFFTFAAGETIATYDTPEGHFEIHYTTSGVDAVPAGDTNANNIPDHVEDVGAVYEQVLTTYTTTMGYRAPVDDGDGKFDVYLLNTGLQADGGFEQETCDASGVVCSGFMVEENDFAGFGYPSLQYADELLASHEFFHAVQAAYDTQEGAVIAEGTAVWASEHFDSSLEDLEGFSTAFDGNTDRGLTSPNLSPGDGYTYGSSVFWEYLSQHFDVDVIRKIWEACGATDHPSWTAVIDGVLQAKGATGFDDVYTQFALATIALGERADATKGFSDAAALATVPLKSEELPLQKASFAIFPASYVTFGVTPGTRTKIRAAVGDGVNVALIPIANNAVGDAITGSLDETIDVNGADTIAIQLVNTHLDQTTERPHICVGAPDEVDACLAALSGTTTPPPVTHPQPTEPKGCASTSSSTPLIAFGALLAFVRRPRMLRSRP